MRGVLLITVGTLALIRAAAANGTVDVTACGQTVPDGTIGLLTVDLDCGGSSQGVILGSRAQLQMNGHVIANPVDGVECGASRCTVTGPGEIRGATGIGVGRRSAALKTRIIVSNLSIHDCAGGGVLDSQVSRIVATDVSVTHINEYAIYAELYPFGHASMRLLRVTSSDNARTGILATGRIKGTDVTAERNGSDGVYGLTVVGRRFAANDNAESGVLANSARLVDSTITGNDGASAGFDLLTLVRPRLVNTTCGLSGWSISPTTQHWGVCSGD
jgi:hypothetical protein